MNQYDELWRGRHLIASAGLGVMFSSIVLPYYATGFFLIPMTNEFGWSRQEFQTALLFSSGLGALTAPLVGWLTDRWGVRRIALPSMVGLSLGFLIASRVDGSLWVFYTAYAVMALLGAGTIPVTWSRALATSFFERRGVALGIALAGTGICSMLIPQYVNFFIHHWGWRGAYLALGALPLIALPIVYVWFKPRPLNMPSDDAATAPQWGLTLGLAMKNYRYWLLLGSIFCVYMAISGIPPNLRASMSDRGFTPQDTADAMLIFGIAIIGGRIAVGYLVDRYWAPLVASLSILLPVGGSLVLAGEPNLWQINVSVFLIGLAAGAELDLMAFLAAKYFGLAHFAKIYALAYATLAICSGTSPRLFAMIFDETGSYSLSYLIAAGLFGCGAVLILGLGRYPSEENTSSKLPGS